MTGTLDNGMGDGCRVPCGLYRPLVPKLERCDGGI